jgi:hypothetical protein
MPGVGYLDGLLAWREGRNDTFTRAGGHPDVPCLARRRDTANERRVEGEKLLKRDSGGRGDLLEIRARRHGHQVELGKRCRSVALEAVLARVAPDQHGCVDRWNEVLGLSFQELGPGERPEVGRAGLSYGAVHRDSAGVVGRLSELP